MALFESSLRPNRCDGVDIKWLMCAALTGALTLANPLPVYAQFSMDAISNMQIMQGQNILRQNIIDQAIKGSATKEKLGANSTVYVVSSERTKLNLKKFADQASSTGAEGSKHSLAILDRPDVIDLIGKSIEPLGLRVDDVSHTYALWWMRAWKAGHDKTDKFDRATSLAVASQVAAVLTPQGFKAASK